MCVQCTAAEAGACGGGTPVCDGETCRACTQDAECASLVCSPDGTCEDPLRVLYAAVDGSAMSNCMPPEPCSLIRALSLIDGTKVTIRLDPGRYQLAAPLTLGIDTHLVGRDAVLDRDAAGTGAVLTITDGTHVILDHLTVQGGDGATGHGIRCVGGTLTLREVTVQGNDAAGIQGNECALTLSHARVLANQGQGLAVTGGSVVMTRTLVVANQGGGVALSGAPYDLENNVIALNGSPVSGFGGLLISQIAPRTSHVFDFNTVVQNQAGDGGTPGVLCAAEVTPLGFTNSIVFGNAAGTQVGGTGCAWTFSDIGPVAQPGLGNLSVDPQLIAPSKNNFHLQVSSPVRDAADPAATLATDLDGDARPQGAGRDMGADEIQEIQ